MLMPAFDIIILMTTTGSSTTSLPMSLVFTSYFLGPAGFANPSDELSDDKRVTPNRRYFPVCVLDLRPHSNAVAASVCFPLSHRISACASRLGERFRTSCRCFRRRPRPKTCQWFILPWLRPPLSNQRLAATIPLWSSVFDVQTYMKG